MKRILSISLLMLVLTAASAALALQASEAPQSRPIPEGSAFPNLKLSGNLSAEQAAYLGLAASDKNPRLSKIKAPFVLLEVFSMYCPHCQREAPAVNELYSLIERRGLAGAIKLAGLGAGNSLAEVEIFRAKYGLLFPLFCDPELTAHQAVGSVGTPYFYLLAKDKKTGAFTVKLSRLGRMDSPEQFLDELAAAAGLPKAGAQ
ncbi:MAG: TlpA family protein disulfide reductase [Desulfovibrionaceae bacterium]|nr:TlpA family protein disulfide reductase [Desulfovibrionaceae bacterium]MBF0515053.1 TlpA family protein disulfide reductase [Desulfovibrionaceae bacterium]